MSEPETKRTRWTFDEPCTVMETNDRAVPSLILEKDPPATDLNVIFVAAPLEGKITASMVDPSAPQNVAEELLRMAFEYKESFQNASSPGARLPTLRIIMDGTTRRYALVGLGKALTKEGIGLTIGSTVAYICAEELSCTTCTVSLPENMPPFVLREIASSFGTHLYSDNRYRTNVKVPAERLKTVYICTTNETWTTSPHLIHQGLSLASGQTMAMDIVNAPHNVLNSVSLANLARTLADESVSGKLTCQILDKADCERLGMGAYLAVARGSETEPQFIHLTYNNAAKHKLGIVGKGVLFDTGGYNIKTQMMELMKFDCGGAAAVLGAAKAIDLLNIEGVEVHFIIAACENMINAKAYVPSDVLTASNGKTIEVFNTDAEGRLTLADALVYADKTVGCDKIIELSTLTGACMVSLGKQIAGVWTDHEELAVEIDAVSKATSEKTWRMPMAKEYSEELESAIADIKNCGTRFGGAIHAALFLQNFVDPAKQFAHIDVAGPVWSDKRKTATGYGVKLITEWVTRQGSGSDGR